MTLCIFTPTGRTFTFKNVNVITDNESVVRFSYKAMSDGLLKIGTFYKTNIVGISLSKEN